MRITEEIRVECGKTCRRMSGKGAPGSCAFAGEVYLRLSRTLRCSRDLTWLASGMATRSGYASRLKARQVKGPLREWTLE
jgi:hypothetical protein